MSSIRRRALIKQVVHVHSMNYVQLAILLSLDNLIENVILIEGLNYRPEDS